MSDKIQAPKGTQDVLPDDAATRSIVMRAARKAFTAFRFREIETPIFERTELFARGVGESTDVVSKEMFTFVDQGGRSLTLRPEGTAAVCRAYVQHGMHKWSEQPVKLCYSGPFFRQEAPQHGRFRQFTQLGAEVLGEEGAWIDAEMIAMLASIVLDSGVEDCEIRISTLGSLPERMAYRTKLQSYLRLNSEKLSPEVLDRLESNPLRAFDSKDPTTIAVMAGAPKLRECISADDEAHFKHVQFLLAGFLSTMEIPFPVVVDDTLVRGLDYYTQTVFELTSNALGAQSALGGGGRYDSLVETIGGPPTPGIGWAAGVERLAMASEAIGEAGDRPIYVAVAPGFDEVRLLTLLSILRLANVPVMYGSPTRSLKSQQRQAGRLDAKYLVQLGGSDDDYDAVVKKFDSELPPQYVRSSGEEFVSKVFELIGIDRGA